MISPLPKNKKSGITILCLGAHADDLEIGCGGSMIRLLEERNNITVCWQVFSAAGARKKEAEAGAALFLEQAKRREISLLDFKDGFFPYHGGKIKEYFESLKRLPEPDLIFTHYRHDLHQDHRLISELTWNTFRNHLILEYEVLKYDGDLGVPNFFFHLSEAICKKKVEIILKSFPSQKKRQWFDREAFFSLMRIRGLESNAPERYAEAFYCRKIVF